MSKTIPSPNLTQENLKKNIHYAPDSGEFFHKKSGNGRLMGAPTGSKMNTGYIRISVDGKQYLAHRLAWLYIHGYLPEQDIDHKNRIRDDNRLQNLREASRQCNLRNSKIRSTNKSGVTGVRWNKQRKKWNCRIMINNNNIYLGVHNSMIDAVKARWAAEVKHGFQNCNSDSTAYKFLKNEGII